MRRTCASEIVRGGGKGKWLKAWRAVARRPQSAHLCFTLPPPPLRACLRGPDALWSAQRLCTGGRKWPVSRLAGRGIRPIPRGALPRAYATGYAGFGVHVRVPVPHLCSSEQRAAGGRRLTWRRWAELRAGVQGRHRGQISRRALGGRSAGTRRAPVRLLTTSGATAINRRRDSSASCDPDESRCASKSFNL